MLPRTIQKGAKIRLLLHSLYAGWCPVTKETHPHCGQYRSNIRESVLVFFKGDYFMVFAKKGQATILARKRCATKSPKWSFSCIGELPYKGLRYHPKNPLVLIYIGPEKKIFNLERPELGFMAMATIKPKPDQYLLRRIHRALEDFVASRGAPASRMEFLGLAQAIVGSQGKAYKYLRAGEGIFWQVVRSKRQCAIGQPALLHYPIPGN